MQLYAKHAVHRDFVYVFISLLLQLHDRLLWTEKKDFLEFTLWKVTLFT